MRNTDLNSVLLEGTAAGEPDCKASKDGQHLARFDAVLDSAWRVSAKTGNLLAARGAAFRILARGPLADACKSAIRKGIRVRALGQLAAEGPADGPWTTAILADHIEVPEEQTRVAPRRWRVLGGGGLGD